MVLHLVALGANSAASRAANARMVAWAARHLSQRFAGRVGVSSLYATPAWPEGSGPEFVNAAMTIEAPMGPEAMLGLLHRIERRQGRVRARRWGPRSLDLDLIATGSLTRPDDVAQSWWRGLSPIEQARSAPDRLILPHPRLQDRGFVLVPLAELAPLWRHPVTGRRLADMAAAVPRWGLRRLGPAALVKA